ncbi:MAG: hypothetical protein IKH64_00475 [Prevotella sp.]|nr:hypothetical protein [Prevotella sp.]
MKKIFILFVLISQLTVIYAQDRYDDYMVVRMAETDAVDVRCEVYPTETTEPWREDKKVTQAVSDLIKNGRYIISMNFTTFGIVILHKQNTEHIGQLFDKTILEKDIQKKFKNGYSVKYYNYSAYYALYEKNPNIKKQVFMKRTYDEEKTAKQLAKQNAKGLFAIAVTPFSLILQDGHEDIAAQRWAQLKGNSFYSSIEAAQKEGWRVGIVYPKYFDYYARHMDYFGVVYNKPRDGNTRHEHVALVRTAEDFRDFVSLHVHPGYTIDMTWSGWDGQTGRNKATVRPASSDLNIWDVLGGLATSVSGLIAGPSSTTSSAAASSGGSGNVGSGSSHSGGGSGKCSLCNGSGKCTAKSYSNRKAACSGSKLCGYCNGTGWVGFGDNKATCTACNGKGECKTCHGTGKCQKCNGTGKG